LSLGAAQCSQEEGVPKDEQVGQEPFVKKLTPRKKKLATKAKKTPKKKT